MDRTEKIEVAIEDTKAEIKQIEILISELDFIKCVKTGTARDFLERTQIELDKEHEFLNSILE